LASNSIFRHFRYYLYFKINICSSQNHTLDIYTRLQRHS